MTWRTISLLILTLGIWSCENQKEEVPIEYGYEYFPLEIGQTSFYQLDSIIFDPATFGTRIDTFSWQLREQIVDTLRDGSGELLYVIERAQRKSDSLSWNLDAVWTASRTETQAFRTEDNLRFMKMSFPLEEGSTWNGNIFIDESLVISVAGETIELFKGWENRILTLNENLNLGDLNFEEVCTIELADNENLIEYRYGIEQYAKGIGLIYKELWVLDTQCQVCCNSDFASCETLAWQEKAEAGFILRQQLIDQN